MKLSDITLAFSILRALKNAGEAIKAAKADDGKIDIGEAIKIFEAFASEIMPIFIPAAPAGTNSAAKP